MGRRFGSNSTSGAAGGMQAPLAVGSVGGSAAGNDAKTADSTAATSLLSAIGSIPSPVRNHRHHHHAHDRYGHGGERDAQSSASAGLEEILRRKGLDEAWGALEDLQRQNILTDKYTVSRMLMKTVGDGRLRMNTARVYRSIAAVEKFIDMQPTEVDEVLFNALLDTCCRLKDLERLESIVTRMRALKVTPSPVTLGILVKTYGQAGDLQKVLQVWDEMEKQRGQANAVTFGCMIDACVKCGNLQKAVDIFESMRAEGKHRNTILYTTLIKGYGLDKDVKSALELFREMPLEGVPYNTITYNSIIDACVKCNDLATAESLMRELTSDESTLEPDLITFSTLLKGYCYIGSLDKALQVAEAIKTRGLRCDELVYNTLMDGCVKVNDVAAGIGLFEELVKNGMRPSAITHSILVRLYQRTGSEEDAAEAVAQLYEQYGIERHAGGDRNRHGGLSRRHYGQRSPTSSFGGGGRSPTHSPLGSPASSVNSGYGMGAWPAWDSVPGMPGHYENAFHMGHGPSAPSTPCYNHSPLSSSPAGPFLPAEAMRSMPMPPPLPTYGGGGSPVGSPQYADARSPTAFFAQTGPSFFTAPTAESGMAGPLSTMGPTQPMQQQHMMHQNMQQAGHLAACMQAAMLPAGSRQPMGTAPPLATPGMAPQVPHGCGSIPAAYFESWANGCM
eukprot:TRINITY_DN16151_c0_g1_i1.p1 TRINITY_DN16151_c0_g1~~TRINITY_DN16151_c0_g1_i1.p1  ORF type:complete len:675 (+),score=173.63 TRINITY_DN16151_c0_g1_i1:52-2076(+)